MSDFQNVGSSHLTVMASSGKYQMVSEINRTHVQCNSTDI